MQSLILHNLFQRSHPSIDLVTCLVGSQLSTAKNTTRVMKILVIAVLSLAFSCTLPFTLGQVDRYKMDIVEKGTPFAEQIDVDKTKGVEVFRVPAHNDVEGADFYHDFKMRVTVTRILSRKVCYIAEMDTSLPSPGKLTADLDQAAFTPGQLPVTTETNLVIVTGPANRLLLTREILVFCGALPIYNTEVHPDTSNGNETTVIRKRRQKRDKTVVNFKSCLRNEGRDPLQYVMDGGCLDWDADWDIKCKMVKRSRSCFYYVTCYNMQPVKLNWNCEEVHKSSRSPICCDFICQT